jgi:hypothetical protein
MMELPIGNPDGIGSLQRFTEKENQDRIFDIFWLPLLPGLHSISFGSEERIRRNSPGVQ